jgi:uncharacterized protein (DUF1778 family)
MSCRRAGSRTREVTLRVHADVCALIDRAAEVQGRSHEDFMIDAAQRAAEDALLDQTLVRVDQETYDFFLSVFDEPPSGDGFQRLMHVPRPWDS